MVSLLAPQRQPECSFLFSFQAMTNKQDGQWFPLFTLSRTETLPVDCQPSFSGRFQCLAVADKKVKRDSERERMKESFYILNSWIGCICFKINILYFSRFYVNVLSFYGAERRQHSEGSCLICNTEEWWDLDTTSDVWQLFGSAGSQNKSYFLGKITPNYLQTVQPHRACTQKPG